MLKTYTNSVFYRHHTGIGHPESASRLEGCASPEAERAIARSLLDHEERSELADPDAIVDDALSAWHRLRGRSDVAAVLDSGERHHEVPFSLVTAVDGERVILRGSIDCVIGRRDGGMVVLEFKTGKPRAEHESQLALYVEAVRALYPSAAVEGRLIYP